MARRVSRFQPLDVALCRTPRFDDPGQNIDDRSRSAGAARAPGTKEAVPSETAGGILEKRPAVRYVIPYQEQHGATHRRSRAAALLKSARAAILDNKRAPSSITRIAASTHAAVAAADRWPAGITEEDALARLLALNL